MLCHLSRSERRSPRTDLISQIHLQKFIISRSRAGTLIHAITRKNVFKKQKRVVQAFTQTTGGAGAIKVESR